ncbi:GFA family protein [Saccharospirillum alexandrii]|uniref:GFA family protein n=1 Tax=Saccharospirillum alexandrii TaxID=2448477 RepID=UPI00373676AA
MSASEQTGACLCGKVRITANPEKLHLVACHCTQCQTWGGGPFLSVDCGGSVVIDGEEAVTAYSSSQWAERGFCHECGTHLYYRLKGTGEYAIPVGLFAGDTNWAFNLQIFIDQKPSCYSFAEQTENLTRDEAFERYS